MPFKYRVSSQNTPRGKPCDDGSAVLTQIEQSADTQTKSNVSSSTLQGNPPTLPARPSSAPGTVPDTTSSTQNVDPWAEAFGLCRERCPDLMADYQMHLASLENGTAAGVDLASRQSVERVVERLLAIREEKQWKVSLLSKDVKLREQAERLAKLLLWADSLVKNAVSTQPYAALAWSGVTLLLPLLSSGATRNEAMLKGFNAISDTQFYWNVCEETYLRDTKRHYRDLLQPLANLYSHIIEYQARVVCHLSRAQLSRAWRDVANLDDWDALAKNITDMSERCSRLIPSLKESEIRQRSVAQLQKMQESREILDTIRRTLEELGRQSVQNYEDQRERGLLQALASDYDSYKDFNPQRVEGTCEWFFGDEKFHQWRDSGSSALLWVSAGPGCGKSVLARALVDEHRLSTNVTHSTVCHFFFKDGDEHRMRSTDALCAVLHQLFTHDLTGSLIGHALPSHKNHGEALARNLSELWRILIECARSSDAGDVVCILDALDECEQTSRNQFINKLKDFYCNQAGQSGSKLKFIITSRPYDDLEADFGRFTSTNYVRFDGNDKSKVIGREIDLVIDDRVRDIAGRFTENDRRKLCERLKGMKNRTYLYLYLVFDVIRSRLSYYKKLSSIERLLSDIPTQVSEAYEKILSRNQDKLLTRALLEMMLAAARPLTLHEANTALALALALATQKSFSTYEELVTEMWPESDFKSTVQNLCGLFVSVYDSKLFFIHQTAREFLVDKKSQGWRGRLSMSMSHRTLSSICINFLLLPNLKDFRALDYRDSLLDYAASYWVEHYVLQKDPDADTARKSARVLCHTSGELLEFWAPIHFKLKREAWYTWTDLALASFLGLKLVVEDLVSEGADVNIEGGRYGTALHAASAEGHVEIVQTLLDKGANVNIEGGWYGTALQAASAEGHVEIVQTLLDKGANVNIQDGTGDTALQRASAKGHVEVVRVLLDKGANVNIKGGRYRTALHAASAKGHVEVVRVLLDKGANVNIEGGWYGTALQAASAGGHVEVVRVLLDKGAGGGYGTAMQAASAGGHVEIVRMLQNESA